MVVVTLLAASSLIVMSGTTIAPSLPAMQQRFVGVANADLLARLVLTVPALLIALCAPVAAAGALSVAFLVAFVGRRVRAEKAGGDRENEPGVAYPGDKGAHARGISC